MCNNNPECWKRIKNATFSALLTVENLFNQYVVHLQKQIFGCLGTTYPYKDVYTKWEMRVVNWNANYYGTGTNIYDNINASRPLHE